MNIGVVENALILINLPLEPPPQKKPHIHTLISIKGVPK